MGELKITVAKMNEQTTSVEYSTDGGDYKIETLETPTGKFSLAVSKLRNVAISKMDLELIGDKITSYGFVRKDSKKGPYWQILLKLTCNMVSIKIASPKIYEVTDDGFWDEARNYEDYPSMLDPDSQKIMDDAWEQASLFISGARLQPTLGLEDPK